MYANFGITNHSGIKTVSYALKTFVLVHLISMPFQIKVNNFIVFILDFIVPVVLYKPVTTDFIVLLILRLPLSIVFIIHLHMLTLSLPFEKFQDIRLYRYSCVPQTYLNY